MHIRSAAIVAVAAVTAAWMPATGAAEQAAALATEWPRPDTSGIAKRLDALMDRTLEDDRLPSIAAAIVGADGVWWQQVVGAADVENDVRAGPETAYFISSISKLIVAVAALQLVERGALDLDADLAEILPFKVRHPRHADVPITTRHLLTHRTGLANPDPAQVPDVYTILPGDTLPPLRSWLGDLLASDQAGVWSERRPGSRPVSSNLGVALLAHVVEVVSGEPFPDYCDAHIFGPLGLTQTSYRAGDFEAGQLAALYHPVAGAIREVSMKIYPAGHVRSTLGDLARFMRAVMNEGALDGTRVLEPGTVETMLEVRDPKAGLAFGSGLAMMWRAYGQRQWMGHTGGGGLVTASFDFDPELRVGVVVLTNAGQQWVVSPPGRLYQALHREAERLARSRPK